MMQNTKAPIKDRWWSKLIRLSTIGIFKGAASLVRWFMGLDRKAKLGFLGGLFAIAIVAGIVGQQQNERARSLGFTSVEEMRKAEKAGFSDKVSWSEHLAELAAQAEAAKATETEEARKNAGAADTSSSGKTLGQWLDEAGSANKKPTDRSAAAIGAKEWRDDFGRTTKQACTMFVRFKSECVSGQNYSACMELKYAGSMGNENRNAYLYDQQMCNDDGTSILDK